MRTRQLFSSLPTWRRGLGIFMGASALTIFLMQIDFNLLEANLYDLRMTKGYQSPPLQEIAIIAIDEQSQKDWNELLPLPLSRHVEILKQIAAAQPKGIGYLADLNASHELTESQNTSPGEATAAATQFVKVADRLDTAGIPLLLGTPFDVNGEVVPPYPLSALHHSVAVIHRDGNLFSTDKVTRRALLDLYGKPTFHLELAQKLGRVTEDFLPRGNFEVKEIEARYFFFRYHGPNGSYPTYSASALLRGEIPAEKLAKKIVLVGTVSKDDSNDFAFTPYSKKAFENPKVGIHATILDSIIRDDGFIRAPNGANILATFVTTAGVIAAVLLFTPLYGVLATMGLALMYMCFAQILFSFHGTWIRESQPLIGIFLSYYLVVPYRLIREYKQRWDFQQKNELLTQVEELKTNFVSLVTHDLKTPVARIQGLAEVLNRKAKDRLIDQDLETLKAITTSTEELNRFITSILELNKVESNRLALQLHSKDINQMIEKSLEMFMPAFRAKKITLATHLDPLFPIKMDSDLVSKMINNLIDNALKYSPEGSEITVSSSELPDQSIEIRVKDLGVGMSEEQLKRLFTRFYRAKNDATVAAGTGLGLYLTKYFAEAHGGRVEVESILGEGSCFKIILPADPQQAGLKTQIWRNDYVQDSRSG